MKGLYMILLGAVSFTAMGQTTNTFPLDGNVGIGTLSPNSKLTVAGDFFVDGIKNTDDYSEKVLVIPGFPNLISNQAVDLLLGNLPIAGYIEVEITGTYNYAPAFGKLTKVFAIGTNPGGAIYTNKSRVSEAIGTVTNEIAIGEFTWDAQNSRYKIPISHITSAANPFSLKVRIFSFDRTASAIHSALSISPQYTLTALPRNYVNFDGDVGIGTTDPKGYKLAVNGKVRAHEIKVETANWPDYVFAKDYQLPTLQEIKTHIKDKGHLPGIPSAADVKANGVDLGEMNAKLLQKIEELTLHLIEKDKQNQVLNERMQKLEDDNARILKQLKHEK